MYTLYTGHCYIHIIIMLYKVCTLFYWIHLIQWYFLWSFKMYYIYFFTNYFKVMNYNFIYLLTFPGFCFIKFLIPVRTDMLNMKLHVLRNVLITIHYTISMYSIHVSQNKVSVSWRNLSYRWFNYVFVYVCHVTSLLKIWAWLTIQTAAKVLLLHSLFRPKQSWYSRKLRLCPTSSAVTVFYFMWKYQKDCLDKDGRDR